MHEILDHLPPQARVLDLGSHTGSFPAEAYRFVTVRVDIETPGPGARALVQADAARLPFRSRTFDAVILNHSIEHFDNLKRALQEVGRVVKRDGAVFASVPDATTIGDRVYRKVFRDVGGHVNLFNSPVKLAKMLSWYFGLPPVATRTLCCSFSFLNRRNTTSRAVRRQMRFRGLPEWLLALFTGALRSLDRRFQTRASVYGWAFYFGRVPEPVLPEPYTNVCIRCGQGNPSDCLVEHRIVRKRWKLLDYYDCPACGAANVYTRDLDLGHLKSVVHT